MSWLKLAIHLLQHSLILVSYKLPNVSNLTLLDLSKKTDHAIRVSSPVSFTVYVNIAKKYMVEDVACRNET